MKSNRVTTKMDEKSKQFLFLKFYIDNQMLPEADILKLNCNGHIVGSGSVN